MTVWNWEQWDFQNNWKQFCITGSRLHDMEYKLKMFTFREAVPPGVTPGQNELNEEPE